MGYLHVLTWREFARNNRSIVRQDLTAFRLIFSQLGQQFSFHNLALKAYLTAAEPLFKGGQQLVSAHNVAKVPGHVQRV